MLLSRDALISALFCETDRAQRMNTPLSVLCVEIERGAALRARFGPDAFDSALGEIVSRISKILRCYDSLGRMDATGVMVLLPGCTRANAVRFADRLRLQEFQAAVQISGTEVSLALSYGVAESRGRSPLVVMQEAEEELRRARAKAESEIAGGPNLAGHEVDLGLDECIGRGREKLLEDIVR